MSNNNITFELTPRQFSLYKIAYQIIRHHANEIYHYQKQNQFLNQPAISFLILQMKQFIIINPQEHYQISLDDLRKLKADIYSVGKQFDVNDNNINVMLWSACNVVSGLFDLLLMELLYDYSPIELDEVPDGL